MSIAKIHHVKSAQKQHECEVCKKPIEKGTSYFWFEVGFRSRYTHKRHSTCPMPRRSELESSRFAEAYAAIEDAEESIKGAEDVEDIRSAIDECAQAWNDLASEYNDASTDDNGNVFNTEAEERAQSLEASSGELESWDPEETDEDWHCTAHEEPEEDCADCAVARDEGLDRVREQALEHLQSAEQF